MVAGKVAEISDQLEANPEFLNSLDKVRATWCLVLQKHESTNIISMDQLPLSLQVSVEIKNW